MLTKGFTLIECLCTLFVIVVLMVAIPFLKPTTHTLLHMEMITMKEKLLAQQHLALSQKKTIPVDFQGNTYRFDTIQNTWNHDITCSDVHFIYTPQGTINQANTLTCSLRDASLQMVIELGSGRMYVR